MNYNFTHWHGWISNIVLNEKVNKSYILSFRVTKSNIPKLSKTLFTDSYMCSKHEKVKWSSEIAQWLKVLASKPDLWSTDPTWWKESSDSDLLPYTCVLVHTHAKEINVKNVKWRNVKHTFQQWGRFWLERHRAASEVWAADYFQPRQMGVLHSSSHSPFLCIYETLHNDNCRTECVSGRWFASSLHKLQSKKWRQLPFIEHNKWEARHFYFLT